MNLIQLAFSLSVLLLALAVVAVLMRGRGGVSGAVYSLSAIASGLLGIAGVAFLLRAGAPQLMTLPIGLPWLGMHLRLDVLSAFFLIVIGLGGALNAIYGLGYGRHEEDRARVLPFYPSFLAAMTLVVLADDAFSFLLSWELMSLLSWALVLSHHRKDEARQAGVVYLIMAAFGTMSLLLAFGLLAREGGYGFEAMRAGAGVRDTAVTVVVILLMLLGAGSKAGIVPLHVWLPLAHPAAPSHVSALMSGIMTKVAIYGFVRVTFDLLAPAPWWMAMVVMAIGAVTAVMGVLYAMMQHDLKRLLAYHTVENIGIIFIGLGLAMGFRSNGMETAGALAMTAALFHVLNHSLFKSLLFMGAGSVLTATGTRDMDRMGGLIHRLPVTSLLFLIGAVAISALPPFNGFVSEWLTFQAILLSPELPQWGLKILTPGVGGMLALAAALAAACFVKVYGVVFLGRPRAPEAASAVEVDRWSQGAMAALALFCLALGIMPGLVIDALQPIALALTSGLLPAQASDPWMTIAPIGAGRASYNGLLVLLFIAASAMMAAWLIHRLAARGVRRAPAWDCGFEMDDPTTQYSAASFAQPIRRTLGSIVFRARETVHMPPPGDNRPAHLEVTLLDPVWDSFYGRIHGAVAWLADRANVLQFLTIRRYLSIVFALLVFLLLVLTLWN